MKSVLRGILVVLVVGCAVPGLVFILGRLVELKSTYPFGSGRAEDAWTTLHVVNFFILQYTSPVVVPLMWGLVFFLRRSQSSAARSSMITLTSVSTIGVLGYWIWIQ